MRTPSALIAAAALVVAVSLQGCGSGSNGGGGGGSDDTTTTTLPSTTTPTTTEPHPRHNTTTTTTTTTRTSTTTSTSTATHPPGWRLNPIEVVGSHLFDSVTRKRFNAKGICFPNVGDDVDEWIKVLYTVRNMSEEINVLRIYVPPTCAMDFQSDCFKPFIKEADYLGFYLLLPGTGTKFGWLPGSADACTPKTAQGCYQAGGVLGWGQTLVQNFNFPNILAYVIGNEFDMQMLPYFPVIKAYARDLKEYMNVCNDHPDSPSRGQMRMIPLMYANSDDRGDILVQPKAEYLFCGGNNVSIDIFGLNIERYCDDVGGHAQYVGVNKWVGESRFPGAFLFSEDGCTKTVFPNHIRTWSQVIKFFENFPALAGFAAYAYNGNVDFDMFDGPFANSTMNEDGTNFCERMKEVGGGGPQAHDNPKVPECASHILEVSIDDFNEIKSYDTGPAGLAKNCPKPYNPPTTTTTTTVTTSTTVSTTTTATTTTTTPTTAGSDQEILF